MIVPALTFTNNTLFGLAALCIIVVCLVWVFGRGRL